jgi:23S rRNA (adenine2503-C2)-methyltransferase
MKNLRDFTYDELIGEVAALGEKPYRALQIYKWVFGRLVDSVDSMTDISKAFRDRLKEEYTISGPGVIDVAASTDGTKKFLSECADGARLESVIIPEAKRLTLCVSSQAGCALGCRFCMTGLAGFVRNLTLSELAGQVISANGLLEDGQRLTNVVLMGMGEPLLNYDNVVRFLHILTDGRAFGFSHNKVTLSTAGIVPGIKRLAEDSNVNLAVSLNATTDEVRDRLMPVNRKYPLSELMEALRRYPLKGKKHVTIEYVLIKDVNDTLSDARRLVSLLRVVKCKINLIPLNEFPGSEFKRPSGERVSAFHKIIMDAGYNVVVRSSKGVDIEAACGQLRGRYTTEGTFL